MTPAPAIDRFLRTFDTIEPDRDMRLWEVYAPDIVFEDPMRRVVGLPALQAHFDGMNARIRECAFEWGDLSITDGRGFVAWRMHIHGRPPTPSVTVAGVSHLRFTEGEEGRIVYQRDYFDIGELVYEKLPLLGSLVRFVKSRL